MSMAIVVFNSSSVMKQVGYFCMAVLHMRITISFCHASELVSEKHKPVVSTIINIIDSGSIMCAAVYFLYVDNNTQKLLEFMFYLGTVVSILYIALIPESPRFLFMKDPNS